MRLSSGLLRRQPQEPPPSSSSVTNAPTPTSSLTSSISPTSSPTTTQSPSPTATPSSTASSSSSNKTPAIIAVVAVLVVISAIAGLFVVLRNLRQKNKNPKYIPTSFLKKRWEQWEPGNRSYRLPETNDHLEPISNARNTGLRPPGRSSNPPSAFDAAARSAVETAAAGAAGVDRNTSVRSVMTLPAYNQHAMQNEQVLGREGERGGIDVVVEFPEGADEEEARRDEEMEALYQVRLARRRENEEREERRRLRREARERGDYVALREIQARARASSSASGVRTVEELRAEHERIKKERLRAISSVSYADLGIARHDGTRLRANSVESEREGLLGDSASIAASSQYHRRERSGSSVLSIDTINSDLPSPGMTRSRANSRGDSPLRRVYTSNSQNEDTSNEGRAGSSPEMIEHDDVPLHDPPGYENISLDTPRDEHRTSEPPPDYSSPIVTQGATFDSPATGPSADETPSVQSTGKKSSQPISRAGSSSSVSGGPAADSRRSSRGVGGTPQLPSLRLAHLPSILVDSPSPVVRTIDEDDERDSRPPSAHHPEE